MRITAGSASLALTAAATVAFAIVVLGQRREIRSLQSELTVVRTQLGRAPQPAVNLTLPAGGQLGWEDSPGVAGITMFRAPDGALQMNREIRMNGSGTGALFGVKNASADANGFATDVPGDRLNRFTIAVSGKMWWGNGTDGQDTELLRSAPNTLQTNARFVAENSISIDGAAPAIYAPAPGATLLVMNSGLLQLKLQSPGSDAYLAQGINRSGVAQISAFGAAPAHTGTLELNPEGGDVQVGGALRLSNAYKPAAGTSATGTVDLKDANGDIVHVLVNK